MTSLRLAVLGNPVAHSLSPLIQSAALEFAEIEGTYIHRQVDDEGMARAAAEIRDGRLDGANVTMPHKALAARLADRLSPVAERCGGANTLWREGDRLCAHTTDPDGVRFAWEYAGLPNDVPVLVLGAGGAAAAALIALEGRRCRVSARREEAAVALVDRVAPEALVIGWGMAVPGAVVVNATPLGRAGESLPYGVVDGAVGPAGDELRPGRDPGGDCSPLPKPAGGAGGADAGGSGGGVLCHMDRGGGAAHRDAGRPRHPARHAT